MRRGARPAKAKVDAKLTVARKSRTNEGSRVGDLEKRLAEALKREAATSEILRIISSSPRDIQPVLDAVAENAARLCAAHDAVIDRLDGDVLRLVAHYGPIPARPAALALSVVRSSLAGRTVLDRQAIQVADLQAETEEFLEGSALAREYGFRTVLSVPLLREGVAIGTIALRRTEVQPFTDTQIALLQTFADQAVIAIENVRLFNETKEALEQQTATSEILRVISESQTDVQPVLEAVVSSAARLLEVDHVQLRLVRGDVLELAAAHGQFRAVPARTILRTYVAGRAVIDRRAIHVADIDLERDEYPDALREDVRTVASMPLLRDGAPIGVIQVLRAEVRPLSEKQIALLKTFADQAVIAIENVRLFTELQARNQELTVALAQQTATSEVLAVISGAQTDVQPVFEAIVQSARRLCDASYSTVYRFDGQLVHLVAHNHQSPEAAEAIREAWPMPLSGDSFVVRAIRENAVIHTDMQQDATASAALIARGKALGHRRIVVVPMVREGQPIGAIRVSRGEATPFAEQDIALLRTFADQAVIAIENVRLFNETKEALEQQTATADILGVISSSPTDVQPVLEAIVKSAARLCEAAFATVNRFDGTMVTLGAYCNISAEELKVFQTRVFPFRPTRATASGRALLDRAVVHIHDIHEDPEYTPVVQALERYRTGLSVPMLREDEPIGTITLWRSEVRPFTDKQVAMVRTFADQAVIAIENVRLFNETKEALERQTATSEILRVISRSPTDTRPVLDTIVEHAGRVCGAFDAIVFLVEGDTMVRVAHHGPLPLSEGSLRIPIDRSTTVGVAILECRTIHVEDVLSIPELTRSHDFATRTGYRTTLSAPLLKDGTACGVLTIRRNEVQPFTAEQIALLETFADQAVIAIENVRLFKELQSSNRDLRTALDTQTATSDILRVISRAQTDVQPVFDAIVASSVRLLGAYSGGLIRLAGDQLELVAHTSTDEAGDAAVRATFPRSFQSERVHAQAILDRVPLNIVDAHTDPRVSDVVRASAQARGYRSWVSVPLLRHDEALGTIAVTRREPGGFTNDEIALLQTFADQAVIAIENARLLTELQARTQELTRSVEQLTALGDVGRTLSSTLDLDTVLQTIVTRASQLAGTDACSVFEYDLTTEAFHLRATHNLDEEVVALARRTPVRKGEGVQGRMAVTRQPVQIPDIAEEDAYHGPLRDILLRTGTRALLAIPMLREDQLIGGFTVAKKTPGEFSPEVIELLKTFATQSALAIQNARLFREIADKSRQLEAASQHKSEFLANMSHELRTPLNAIIGFSEVLTERMFGELNEKQEEYLKDIYTSGQHLLSLINDILDLSKIEAGRMELELTDFDLPQAISNALTLVRGRAGRRDIALHQAVDQRLGQIRGDERKIKQVLLNLLSNALKFTPEGGRVDVRASVVDGMAEVSVADTGVGIAPGDQEAVFEEFRQVGTADKKVEGTGLGLTLSRKFIELHGGRIWVKSQVGVGSTFTFALPLTIDQSRQTG